jgi:hypothetical protein
MKKCDLSGNGDWTTQDELTFLKGLGEWLHPNPPRAPRKNLLEGYLEASVDRNWDRINRDKIMNYVLGEIG